MDVRAFCGRRPRDCRLSERVECPVWMVNTTGEKKWQEAEVEAEREYRWHFADRKRFERIAELREKVPEGYPGAAALGIASIRKRWKTRCLRNCWMK